MIPSDTAPFAAWINTLEKIEVDRAREIAMILLQNKYSKGFDMRDYVVSSWIKRKADQTGTPPRIVRSFAYSVIVPALSGNFNISDDRRSCSKWQLFEFALKLLLSEGWIDFRDPRGHLMRIAGQHVGFTAQELASLVVYYVMPHYINLITGLHVERLELGASAASL